MTSTNKILNEYLGNKRILKQNFDDFKIVIEAIGYNEPILDWFAYLQSIETIGWRSKLATQKLAKMLASASKKIPLNSTKWGQLYFSLPDYAL